jgi:hypothetical protein
VSNGFDKEYITFDAGRHCFVCAGDVGGMGLPRLARRVLRGIKQDNRVLIPKVRVQSLLEIYTAEVRFTKKIWLGRYIIAYHLVGKPLISNNSISNGNLMGMN